MTAAIRRAGPALWQLRGAFSSYYQVDMDGLAIMWKCLVCGHMWPDRGEALPDSCTNCGAPKTEFELVTED